MVIYEFSSSYYYQTHINLNLYNNIMNFLQGYCSFHHYLLPVILRDIIVYISISSIMVIPMLLIVQSIVVYIFELDLSGPQSNYFKYF